MSKRIFEAALAAEGLSYIRERGPNSEVLDKVYTKAVGDLNMRPSDKNKPTSSVHKFYDPTNRRDRKAEELAIALSAEDIDAEKIYRGTTPSVKVENEIVAEIKDEKGLKRASEHPDSAEKVHLFAIQQKIEEAVNKSLDGSITLQIGETTLSEVVQMKDIEGHGKADFSIVNKNGEEVFWISHKAGSTAADFQQYAGVLVGANHPEVLMFGEDIQKIYGHNLPRSTYLYREIQDPVIKIKAMYEDHLTQGDDFGPHKVNVIIQGHMGLEQFDEDAYNLSCSHLLEYGDIPEDDYEPVMFVSFRFTPKFQLPPGRGVSNPLVLINHCRFMIQSRGRSKANSKLQKI